MPHYNPHYESLRTQPICLPYKAMAQENFWDNKTGVITGYAHQDKAATYLGNTQMTTLSNTRCNEIMNEEVERIKECKFFFCFSVVEFHLWWVKISLIFGQKSTFLQCKPDPFNENRYSLCPHSHRENLL